MVHSLTACPLFRAASRSPVTSQSSLALMDSANEADDAEETSGCPPDYCYEDFDASLSDDATNAATPSSCSTPSSLTASSRGPPSVTAADDVRSDAATAEQDEEQRGPVASSDKQSGRCPATRKKKDHVSSVASCASDRSSEYMREQQAASPPSFSLHPCPCAVHAADTLPVLVFPNEPLSPSPYEQVTGRSH